MNLHAPDEICHEYHRNVYCIIQQRSSDDQTSLKGLHLLFQSTFLQMMHANTDKVETHDRQINKAKIKEIISAITQLLLFIRSFLYEAFRSTALWGKEELHGYVKIPLCCNRSAIGLKLSDYSVSMWIKLSFWLLNFISTCQLYIIIVFSVILSCV